MKILEIHKDFRVRGGASRYFLGVSRLLADQGHEVAFFSTSRKGNAASPWSKYFIPYLSYEKPGYRQGVRLFFHMLYSIQARRQISRLLDVFQPDIVHLHSIYHQLSPSILYEIRKRRIPVVMTVHDFHLIAPNHTLFHDGKVCEITKKKNYYKALNHKCIKGSALAGLADAAEHYFHDVLGVYSWGVDLYLCPSRFYAGKLAEYGIDKKRAAVLPNFSPVTKKSRMAANHVLYAGRLSEEKGLHTLLAAAARLPHIPFVLAGEGPLKEELQAAIKDKGLKNVRLTGYRQGDSLKHLIEHCRFLVLPSLCYENCPLSILEAFAAGKPVIASRTGGIPELVRNNKNGILFPPGDTNSLKRHIEELWKSPALVASLGGSGRADAELKYNGQRHYRDLISYFRKAVKTYKAR